MVKITKKTLFYQQLKSSAFLFLPEKPTEQAALFTHGYTSHKGSLLTWGQRLASCGITTIIFDLPGHFLGSFEHEVESFEQFTTQTPFLFQKAWEALPTPPQFLSLGGHSLGALMAFHALELDCFHSISKQAIGVGFGLADEEKPHLMETKFYEKTIQLRRQLVSSHLAPERIFPWIRQQKQNLKLKGQKLFLLNGQDDVIVGKWGTERLQEVLEKDNQLLIKQPRHLPHHLPELAASYLEDLLATP